MPIWSDAFSGYSNYRLDWLWSTKSQDIANNRSLIQRKLSITRTGGSGTLNFGTSSWSVTGGTGRSGTFTYDFRGYTTLVLMSDEIWVKHDADGSLSVTTSASVNAAGSLGDAATGNKTVTSPTIPRASTATLPSTVTLGSAVTINTNRASSAFTHTLQLWEYGVGATSPIQTVASGVGASVSWAPALSLATYFPDAVSRKFFIRTITYNGSTQVGSTDTVFTLQAPSSMVPTISAINVVDDNPDVVSAIGGYVQGQSRLKATVVAAGVHGSTIASSVFTVDGLTAASGKSVALSQSGTRVVSAAVVDSRGRAGASTGNITVLAYDIPKINDFMVERATSAGVPSPTGTYLRMTLDASASSLIVGTQKNSLTITVSTRLRGQVPWTTRNVITAGIGYDNSVLIDGGGIYATASAYEIRVDVKDKLQTSTDFFTAPTAGAIVDATEGKQAFGKMVETSGPDSQMQGPGRLYDVWDVDGRKILDAGDYATQAEVNAGDSSGIMTADTARNASWAPFAVAAGRLPGVNVAAGAIQKTSVTFPAGRFTQPPVVTVTQVGSNYRDMVCGAESVTASGMTVWCGSAWDPGTGRNGVIAEWTAVQMTSGGGAG